MAWASVCQASDSSPLSLLYAQAPGEEPALKLVTERDAGDGHLFERDSALPLNRS